MGGWCVRRVHRQIARIQLAVSRRIPRAQRIAEVYENDLASYRAAAMEYEEILQMDLQPKRWGWAAIHLCNLYSGKLGETEKALELLRRVAEECADPTPGEKARDRLAKIDSL